jgi:isopenicillin N synthase-like dioxygenase
MPSSIPLLDLQRWFNGSPAERAAFAAELDVALQESGFLMVAGHGIPAEWKVDLRAAASRFFALPTPVKAAYTTEVVGRGWIPPGKEANSFYGIDADPNLADLKESYVSGPRVGTGDPAVDAEWFQANVWPAEVPELEALTLRFAEALDDLHLTLLEICASALGLPADWFTQRAQTPTRTLNINRYPPLSVTGPAREGQYRIGPHTDWGTLTILDRQPGYGGLQLVNDAGEWENAPFVDNAFTINVGDLLARWTGDRWRSTRHRVLPPSDAAPDEELMSLVAFYEVDYDIVIESFPPPIGHLNDYEPVKSGEYLMQRAAAATV